MYGLLVLILTNLATLALAGQYIYFENPDVSRKILIVIVIFILLLFFDRWIMRILSRKIKKNLPVKKKKTALKKLKRKKYLTNGFLTVLCLCLGVVNVYYYKASDMLSAITLTVEPSEITGYVYVTKDSGFSQLSDNELVNIGFDEAEQSHSLSLFIGELEKKYQKVCYRDYNIDLVSPTNDVYQKLLQHELDAIIIGQEVLSSLQKTYPDFDQELRRIDTLTIKTGVDSLPVNVEKESFNVLIAGIDVREGEGDIYSNTRTDTLMVATLNPDTMQMSLISVPRDSYVQLSSDGSYDKITHAGLDGIGCTIQTVEALLDIDINYYAKFNFAALVNLVDTLGGIDVDVKYSFTEQDSHDQANAISLEAGLQHLNGEEALAYARHRKTQNDHVRNASQQQVIAAILKRLASFDTITKIDGLLQVMKENMTTNFSRTDIYRLMNLIPKLGNLQMSNMVLEGTDLQEYVYKYDQVLWITELDAASIDEAHQTIEEIMQKEVYRTTD